jgi:hypothetical protein
MGRCWMMGIKMLELKLVPWYDLLRVIDLGFLCGRGIGVHGWEGDQGASGDSG